MKRKIINNMLFVLSLILILGLVTACETVKPAAPTAEAPATEAKPETVLEIVNCTTTKTLTLGEIEAMPSYTADGGLWAAHRELVKGPFKYTGVKMTDLLDLVGGIGKENAVKVIASDEFEKIFTYDQVKGDFATYDKEGNPIEWSQPITVVLAYEQGGESIAVPKGGPIKIATVGPDGPITPGDLWVKGVVKIEIVKAPPSAEFALTPIVIEDAGEKIEISIDDIAKYHGHLCPCSGMAFRVARFGISSLWGSEIPKREDIKIISHLPTVGSADCFFYVTGTGPSVPHIVKGEFDVILSDGTEVTDYSPKNLKNLSKDMRIGNWNFVIMRKSTGERFEVQVKEDFFAKGLFFELRKKAKFEKTATDEEKKQFQSMKKKILDAVKTQPDDKLFEGRLLAEKKSP